MTIEAQSDIYDTPPFSGVGSDYVNTVVAISTDLTLETIDALCKEYERHEGRDDTCRSRGIVPIDMDVVIYGDTIVRPHEVSRYYFQQGYCSLKD
jgi:2-amino-4-hydroxy-6-hydroxymethyldihydropteridine diphosphokinase